MRTYTRHEWRCLVTKFPLSKNKTLRERYSLYHNSCVVKSLSNVLYLSLLNIRPVVWEEIISKGDMGMVMQSNNGGAWKSAAVPFSCDSLKRATTHMRVHCNGSASVTTNTGHPFCHQVEEAVDALYPAFRAVDNLVALNTRRVQKAYSTARVGAHHFGGSTGYGHNEAGGREALDNAFADIMGAEAALVRAQFFSGTHAIACALYSALRPGDELLAVAGAPYDTLEEVIGLCNTHGHGSLKEFGISYRELPLTKDGDLDWETLATAVKPETKCALIQRSCGYAWRHSLSISEIKRAIEVIKSQNPECLILVDNCYGEFVETMEPTAVGADMIAGSLIKNPGGTIAPCGGYVAGKEKWVEAAAARLAAPGIGIDSGATPGDVMRMLFQGLFLSPQMVGESIKGSLLVAEVMAAEGYKVQPLPRVPRHDIIQAVQLGNQESLLAFCGALQRCCPVGSYIKPVAGSTSGYASEVVFADGTFIDGSTSELSCDGPLRDPFVVFCQGCTHWTQWALVLEEVLKSI